MRSLSKDFKSRRPLLIQPDQAEAFLEKCASVEMPMGAKMADMGEMLAAIFGSKPTLEKFPPFAVIPIKGVIGKDLSTLESLCGCCDIHAVEEMLEECERDPAIKTIILEIDSPGGTSVGVPELANRIRESAKEIISFTASECCSAAYWIGSQASAFYATPSSTVGSIGVYIAWPDCSEAYKMEGVKMEVIKSGLFKGAGIPGTSLDTNQRKMLQDEVNDIHGDFKAAVKAVRSFVEDASMEGQQFSGKRAAEAGLVTSLVNGFDELMESLDASVAAQMEADEENDKREEGAEAIEAGIEEDEDEGEMSRMASARALSGLKISAAKKSKEEGKEDDGVEPQPEADNTDPEDPDYDPDEDPDLKAKEDAEKESDAGEDAVETDSKHDTSKSKKHRSRGVA